jgi:hypothetical protein
MDREEKRELYRDDKGMSSIFKNVAGWDRKD